MVSLVLACKHLVVASGIYFPAQGLKSALVRSLGEGHVNSLQYFCLENPLDRGAWQATVRRGAELNTTEVTSRMHAWEHGVLTTGLAGKS